MTVTDEHPPAVATAPRRIRTVLGQLVTVAFAAIVAFGIITGPSAPGDRVDSLAAVIKCPQCQGESIKDSSALTARTMRTMVAEQVAAGRTDDEILDFFRGLYGDQAILEPRLSASTVLLWAVPAASLVGGIWLVAWMARGRDR